MASENGGMKEPSDINLNTANFLTKTIIIDVSIAANIFTIIKKYKNARKCVKCGEDHSSKECKSQTLQKYKLRISK